MTTYFAYGANMDPVHMASQCPGARRLGLATLPDHRFAIAARGFGTIAPAAGETIRGVLWELTAADLAALDVFEGVPEGWYRMRELRVLNAEGQPVDAMLYYAADDAPGVASPGYLERIIEVAGALGFPPDYLAGLQSHLAS